MPIGSLKIKKAEPKLELLPFLKEKIAIVDGDVICYQSCPPRQKLMIDENEELVRLGPDGKRAVREFTPEENEAYIEQSWLNLKYNLTNLADKLWCDDALIAVGGGPNFRDTLFPEYKAHRSYNPAFKNIAVPVLRKRAVDSGIAVFADGLEADDLLRIWAGEASRIGQDYVICSIDKDLLCIPGEHYLMHKGKEQTITVSQAEADRHYYEQILSGDSTDNIPGVPGIGPKKAIKALADCVTNDEMEHKIVEMYFDAYGPDEWRNALLINGKLIHILAHESDYFTLDNWRAAKELD